jgi:chaperone modulatory protein CbpM
MITIETLIVTIEGLDRAEVEHWIAESWVRPAGSSGAWQFAPIDVARLRLIHELRHRLRMEEDALPVVLNLLDQLYDARRRLRRLRDAVDRTAPPDVRQALLRAMVAQAGTL